MNKEKQKIISDICPFYKEYGSCEQCNTSLDIGDGPCYFECMANAIIANDYRKQSEGEWIVEEDENGYDVYRCSKCHCENVSTRNYCPECGAHMKGGAKK